jgi:hypothetical protein
MKRNPLVARLGARPNLLCAENIRQARIGCSRESDQTSEKKHIFWIGPARDSPSVPQPGRIGNVRLF